MIPFMVGKKKLNTHMHSTNRKMEEDRVLGLTGVIYELKKKKKNTKRYKIKKYKHFKIKLGCF